MRGKRLVKQLKKQAQTRLRNLLESNTQAPLMFRIPYSVSYLRPAALACLALALLALHYPQVSHSADDKRVTVFAPNKTYDLTVVDKDKQEYASLAELLEPLGKFEQNASRGTYRFRLNGVDSEFGEGKKLARVGKTQLLLPAKAVVENGRLLVPLRAMASLLEKFSGQHCEFHSAGRRLFVGNVGEPFTIEIKRSENSLLLGFPAAVNPTISSENGKVHLLFSRDPVIFGADSFTYNDKLITAVTVTEHNGAVEMVVSGTAPLVASLGDGGKSISVSAVPPAVAAAPPTPAPASASGNTAGQTPVPAAAASNASPAPPQKQLPNGAIPFFVMIDPSHGGDEPGARFSDKLLEKDITLAIARKLRTELRNRGLTAVLLRDSDNTLDYDQRAVATNAQRAAVYVSIHAGLPGVGVRVYTAMMPAAVAEPKNKNPSGPFVPWDTAQAGYLSRSQALAAALVVGFNDGKIPSASAAAPLLPLSHIAAPAVAIEVAPPSVESKPDELNAQKYQQAIAVAAAAAIAKMQEAK